MGLQLYDLAGAEPERRFSPYCWRIKLALMHKGLPFDTITWRFTDKEAIAFSGQGRVPVLVDGEHVVFDSWTIATYLEDAYADRPSLFRGEGGRAVTRFVNAWADGVLVGGILRFGLRPSHQGCYTQSRLRQMIFGGATQHVLANAAMPVLLAN